jgi:Leucine-rich repeat (LRR) protein
LSDSGLEALLSSPNLRGCTIHFAGNSIGSAGAALLARSPALTRYSVLDLDGTDIGDDGLITLLRSPYLTAVAEVSLRGCEIGEDGIRALAHAGDALPNLRRLDLSRNDLGDGEIAVLAHRKFLSNLTHLDLESNHVGNLGARALADSTHAGNLEVLSLAGNHVGDAGAMALLRSGNLPRLGLLDLRANRITEAIVAAKSECRLASLQEMRLGDNRITPDGIALVRTWEVIRSALYLEDDDLDEQFGPDEFDRTREYDYEGVDRHWLRRSW